MSVPKNIFITGCNRGLGLEFVKQYLKRSPQPNKLVVTCRDPSKAEELTALASANPSILTVLKLETTDYEAFPELVKKIEGIVGDEGLNLVFHNAAVLPEGDKEGPTIENMRQAFEVNTISPVFLTRALMPLVQKAADKKPESPVGVERAAVIFTSTAVSSIAENSGGGVYAYRSSKAALNMCMKNVSLETKDKGVLVMAMHPGWVRTSMGGPNGMIDTETSVNGMIDTMAVLTEEDRGLMKRYNNTVIPW